MDVCTFLGHEKKGVPLKKQLGLYHCYFLNFPWHEWISRVSFNLLHRSDSEIGHPSIKLKQAWKKREWSLASVGILLKLELTWLKYSRFVKSIVHQESPRSGFDAPHGSNLWSNMGWVESPMAQWHHCEVIHELGALLCESGDKLNEAKGTAKILRKGV